MECRNTKDVDRPAGESQDSSHEKMTLQIASPNRLSLFSYFVLRDYRPEVTLCNSNEIG